MKTFVRHLFFFILFFAGVLVVVIGGASLYMNRVQFKIDPSKTILVIGDSHTECAIDDHAFTRAANYSKSATPFIYSYAALKKLVADNPQIDTVLLSFHAASLSYERAQTWVFGESEIASQVPFFLPYFDPADMALFLFQPQFYKSALETPRSAFEFYKASPIERKAWINTNIGHFRDLNFSNFQKDTAALKPYESLSKWDSVSPVSLNYMHKIQNFCRDKGLTLILFNAPIYEKKKHMNYIEFYQNKERYLKDFLFLDYADFPVADSGRFDVNHLNLWGAKQFSQYLQVHLADDIRKQHPK